MTIFALSITPYISASIALQLLISLLPGLQRSMKDSPDNGKRKLAKYRKVGTLVISTMMATAFASYVLRLESSFNGIILPEILAFTIYNISWLFYTIVIVSMVTGCLFLMWIGDKISEHGIGNGISLIITLGILSRFPTVIGMVISNLNLEHQEAGQMGIFSILLLVTLFVGIVVGTILILQGQRNIPVQHARRIVGRREMQGGHSYIPLKLNYAGVMPVIFASMFLSFFSVIIRFLGWTDGILATIFTYNSWSYITLFCLFIMSFTYVWTATQFRPDQIASDMKRNGAFIPGIRQGKPTQEFLASVMNKITFSGALFLASIAIIPVLMTKFLGINPTISNFFGGTSLLIIVGVILDTMNKIEGQLLAKRYDGFMMKNKT